jgi:YaiO family outer membrane protein
MKHSAMPLIHRQAKSVSRGVVSSLPRVEPEAGPQEIVDNRRDFREKRRMKRIALIFLLTALAGVVFADAVDSLIAKKDLPGAEKLIRVKLDTEPRNGDARLRLALVLSWEHKYAEAVPHFRWLLTENPDNPDAVVGLSNCLLWSGDRDQAREVLVQAIQVNDRAIYRKYLSGLDNRTDSASLMKRPVYKLWASYEYTANNRGDDWNEDSEGVTISYRNRWVKGPQKLSAGIFRERDRRYRKTDEAYGLTLYLTPKKRITWGNELTIAATEHFLPGFKYHTNVFGKLCKSWELIGSAGYSFSNYHDPDKQVSTAQVGLEYYFPHERYLAGRYYLTFHDNRSAGSGSIMGSARLTRVFTGQLSASTGSEILDGRSGSLSSWRIGAKLTANVLDYGSVYLSAGYGEWENDLIRRDLGGGLQIRF